MNTRKIILWILAVVSAIILLQTLFFKFSAAEESVYIFSKLGMEPYGRIGSGVAELMAAILLLIPITRPHGALLAALVMLGAIASHLGPLGIEVMGDGGTLFIMALIVFVCCLAIVIIEKGWLIQTIKQKSLKRN